MKKEYEKPMIEVEDYEINTAIASGCANVVNLGPGDALHGTCSDYADGADLGFVDESWGDVGNEGDAAHEANCPDFGRGKSHDPTVANFYEVGCSCYLSAGAATIFTS